jgi:hypothetical protein
MEIRLVNALSLYLKLLVERLHLELSMKKVYVLTIAAILVCGCLNSVFAQQKKRVIQLSGVILEEDSVSGRAIPGVHVYVPKAGRGTTSNGMGFFSMPVLVNDEIIISAVGYNRQFFTVPANSKEYETIVVTLTQDTTYLPEVTIMSFPTEEVFKQAVLALNVPMDNGIDARNFQEELMALMLKTQPMDGYSNQRYYLDQWAQSANNRFQPVTNPFLNPFNWAKFFSQMKKDKKKK